MRKPKKEGKHLKFYKDYIETGKMPVEGLCKAAVYDLIDGEILIKYFRPSSEELHEMNKRGEEAAYWASNTKKNVKDNEKIFKFNTLRQNIVLFMAAINKEL